MKVRGRERKKREMSKKRTFMEKGKKTRLKEITETGHRR